MANKMMTTCISHQQSWHDVQEVHRSTSATLLPHQTHQSATDISSYLHSETYCASVIISSSIKRFDVSGEVRDENWNTISTILDKKTLVFLVEISSPLQQTNVNMTAV